MGGLSNEERKILSKWLEKLYRQKPFTGYFAKVAFDPYGGCFWVVGSPPKKVYSAWPQNEEQLFVKIIKQALEEGSGSSGTSGGEQNTRE